MQRQDSTRRKKHRPHLKGEHKKTYWYLVHAFECKSLPDSYKYTIEMSEPHVRYIRNSIRRLAKIAGVNADRKHLSVMFDDALKEVYVRAREDEKYDTGPAFRIASRVGKLLESYAKKRSEREQEKRTARDERPDVSGHLDGGLLAAFDKAADLHARLERLREYGDETDEGAAFRLEKRIQEVERQVSDDEWPDWIPG